MFVGYYLIANYFAYKIVRNLGGYSKKLSKNSYRWTVIYTEKKNLYFLSKKMYGGYRNYTNDHCLNKIYKLNEKCHMEGHWRELLFVSNTVTLQSKLKWHIFLWYLTLTNIKRFIVLTILLLLYISVYLYICRTDV